MSNIKSSNREISFLHRLSSSSASRMFFSFVSFFDLSSSYSERTFANSLSTATFTALSSSIWESMALFSALNRSMTIWYSCKSFCTLEPSSDCLASFLTVSSRFDFILSFSRCKFFNWLSCSEFFWTAIFNSRSSSSRKSRSSFISFWVVSSLLSYSISLTPRSSCAPWRVSQDTFIVIPSWRSVSSSVTSSEILSFSSSTVFSFFARAFFKDCARPCCSLNWLATLTFSSLSSTVLSLESVNCSLKFCFCDSNARIVDSICVILLRIVKSSSSEASLFRRRLEISSSPFSTFFSRTAICCRRSNSSPWAVSSWIEYLVFFSCAALSSSRTSSSSFLASS